MKINKYTCSEKSKENINFFRGTIYATSDKTACLEGRNLTISEGEFAIRTDSWEKAIKVAQELYREVEKGDCIVLDV